MVAAAGVASCGPCVAQSRGAADRYAQAIMALGDLGPIAKPALPTLTRLLDDSNAMIRQAAEEATKKINQ